MVAGETDTPPTLPQRLGALDVADDHPELARAGFETAQLIEEAKPAPDGPPSSFRQQLKPSTDRPLLAQERGALEAAKQGLTDLAATGFKTAKQIAAAKPTPPRSRSSFRQPPKPG